MVRGKEVNINVLDDLNTSFGSTNKENPKSLYITFTGWALPTDNSGNKDYDKVIKGINKQIRQVLYSNLNPLIFDIEKTITYFDMRESGIVNGKRSYMSTEINLYQKNKTPKQLVELDDTIRITVEILHEKVFKPQKDFIFTKTKS